MSEESLSGVLIKPLPAGIAEGQARFVIRSTGLFLKSLEVRGVDWTDAMLPNLTKAAIAGLLSDGRHVIIEPSSEGNIGTDGAEKVLRLKIDTLRVYSYAPPGHSQATWMYRLLNLEMRSGDLSVTESTSNNRVLTYRDTIRFQFGGREWFLRSDLLHPDNKKLSKFKEHTTAIRSGVLWSPHSDGDKADELDLLAIEICNLLSFATSRSVRWSDRHLINEECSPQDGLFPFQWCAAACEGGNGPIDTFGCGKLAGFIETAESQYRHNPDWWNRTLELHLQGTLSRIVDVRLTFFYVLLDRVSSHVCGSTFPPQIDKDLKGQLKAHRKDIHETLAKLSPNWSSDRTKQVIEMIKFWNAGPSFVKRVQQSAASLDLAEPHSELVSPRNLSLHSGELPKNMPSGIQSLGDFQDAVHSLVTAMLMRMLQHEGDAYLPGAGPDYSSIHPWPDSRPVPWSPTPT